MTTAIHSSTPPAIEYPDSDGLPMAENTLQFKWIVLVKEGIEALFAADPNVFVAGDLFWYPVEGDPNIRTAPDVLVAVGRPKGNRGSYRTWEENGVAPQVVFEILSPSNRPGEMERKRLFYEKYGVEEYYIYDPDSGLLEGWLRNNEILEPITQIEGFVSPRLQIRFEPGEGPDNLTIREPSGARFRTPLEKHVAAEKERQRAEQEHQRAEEQRQRAEQERLLAQRADQRAEQERQRAEQERQRAEQERQRAEQERQRAEQERLHAQRADQRAEEERLRAHEQQVRAERLAAKLRELGIEPE
jgi:Uma2 family endonuclease